MPDQPSQPKNQGKQDSVGTATTQKPTDTSLESISLAAWQAASNKNPDDFDIAEKD